MDWLKATARTKREGGVKSPGSPSIPAPMPVALSLNRLELDRRRVVHGEIQVIAQVSHLPVERRHIRDHTQRVIVDVEFAVDILDHDALAGGVVNHVVDLENDLPSIEDNSGDDEVLQRRPSLPRRWHSYRVSRNATGRRRESCPPRPRCKACNRPRRKSRTCPPPDPFR